MSYNDQVVELCGRIRAGQNLEEVEKAGAELRTILRTDIEELAERFATPSGTAFHMPHPRSREQTNSSTPFSRPERIRKAQIFRPPDVRVKTLLCRRRTGEINRYRTSPYIAVRISRWSIPQCARGWGETSGATFEVGMLTEERPRGKVCG